MISSYYTLGARLKVNTDTTPTTTTVIFPPLWRRVAAMVYDTLLILAISMGYGGLILIISKITTGNTETLSSGIGFQLGWLASIVLFFCFFWYRGGQTLGMRSWRLQLKHKDPSKSPSCLQCFCRCVLMPLGLALFIVGLIRKDKQCLHDTLSHTQLVLTPKIKK